MTEAALIFQNDRARKSSPTEGAAAIQCKTPWFQPGSDDSASQNQSVLGEEDPGAAADSRQREKSDRSQQLRRAISRWENEGGADGGQAPESSKSGEGQTEVHLTNAELVQLQIRMIALENLVTALLAGAPDQTHDLARAMAAYISPRPGSTPHHLTIHAAAQMVHLVERSTLFRVKPSY